MMRNTSSPKPQAPIISSAPNGMCVIRMAPLSSRLPRRSLQVRHWLLQSCHSPFVWPDFGDYLSVPLALLLRGSAKTVISSIRVQTFIPYLLSIYLDGVSTGKTFGEIVRTLNSLARSNNVDHYPFLLYGHPQSRTALPFESVSASPTNLAPLPLNTGIALESIRRAASNLQVASFQPHFDFNQKSQTTKRFQHQADQLSRTVGSLLREMRVEESLGAVAPISRKTAACDLEVGLSVAAVQSTFCDVIDEHRGYYYHNSDFVENWYMPIECAPIDCKCNSCSSNLLLRKLRYIGGYPSADYNFRRQLICPRCLIVSDVADQLDINVTLEVTAEADGKIRLTLKASNPSKIHQHLTVRWKMNDPNNVSRSIAPELYDSLLMNVSLTPNSSGLIIIDPLQTVRADCVLGVTHSDLFYLLVEVTVILAGTWNWLSYTYRSPKIVQWMDSPSYNKTLPK